MSSLSFYEKSAWGTLIVLLVLGALYFQQVIGLWKADLLIGPSVLAMAGLFTVFLVVALVSFHVLIAIIDRPGDEDERDRLIGRQAAYWSGHAMGFGVFSVIFMILAASALDRPDLSSPMVIVQALIAVVLLAEVIDLTFRSSTTAAASEMGGRITNSVRALREGPDRMTQQALAEAVGVSRQTINAIETGKYQPSLEVAIKIARVFEAPVESIFSLSDDA